MVEWQHWVDCLDVMGRREVLGREVKGMVSIREGRLIVMAPVGGSFVFGRDHLAAARGLSAAITLGVVELGDAGRDRRPERDRRPRPWERS